MSIIIIICFNALSVFHDEFILKCKDWEDSHNRHSDIYKCKKNATKFIVIHNEWKYLNSKKYTFGGINFTTAAML